MTTEQAPHYVIVTGRTGETETLKFKAGDIAAALWRADEESKWETAAQVTVLSGGRVVWTRTGDFA